MQQQLSYGGVIVNLGNAEWDRFTVMYAFSVSSEEKLMIIHTIASNTAGAGNAPARNQQVAKFVPSPDASITRVDVTNGGSGDFDTSSNLSALGTEGVELPLNVQDGAVYYETDTNKSYVLYNNMLGQRFDPKWFKTF